MANDWCKTYKDRKNKSAIVFIRKRASYDQVGWYGEYNDTKFNTLTLFNFLIGWGACKQSLSSDQLVHKSLWFKNFANQVELGEN